MTIPAATTLVRLVLLLETGEYASYRATIETAEGRRVWDAPELLPRKARRGPAVTVLVPADRLPPGDYVLALRGVTRDGRDEPAAEYSLQVSSSR